MPEHQEVALGEIDHPHRAEDDAEPDAHQRVGRSDQDAGGERLQEIEEREGHRTTITGGRGECHRILTAIDYGLGPMLGAKLAEKFTGNATHSSMLLAIEGLSVNYGGLAALRGVSVSVEQGQFVAIVGTQRCWQDDLVQGHLRGGPGRSRHDHLRGT